MSPIMNRCVWTGLPCSCNNVEAMVNCPEDPGLPLVLDFENSVLDRDFDQYGQGDDPQMGFQCSLKS